MLPNEILPAITRQKVRNRIHKDQVYDVLFSYQHPFSGMKVFVGAGDAVQEYRPEDLEPVPEEPRQFRCGDAVFVRGTVVPGKDADTYGIYSRISGISKSGECKIVDRIDWVKNDDVRHATPSERVQYFN